MANQKVVVGIFEDEVPMMEAIKVAKRHNIEIMDAFTPFPVHGLDKVMELRPSRLDIVAFIFGTLGFLTAVGLQVYTMGIDWPMNIGGKPRFPFPSFIPVTFELTVLFASLGMVATYLIVSRLLPGVEPKLYDPRQTSDHFVVLFRDDNISEEIKNICLENGAIEIRTDEYQQTLWPYPIPIKMKK
ncbi:MAG: DUF3341 domain-containing protein [Bacteroidia bacterium]